MKKKIMVSIIISLLLLSSVGCSSLSKSASEMAGDYAIDNAAPAEDGGYREELSPNLSLDVAEKKVIKNAEIRLTVKNNLEAERMVQELVVKYKGYIQNSESHKSKNNDYTNIEIKLPANNFELFTAEIAEIGDITNNRVYTTDVTEEYIDLAARQKTLSIQENRLQDMLSKANNVDELLKVENELSRIRGEIERITGRLKYLDNMVSYSTVRLTLSTKFVRGDSIIDGFGGDALQSLKSGVKAFLSLLLVLIQVLAFMLPFLVITLIIVLIILKVKGRGIFQKK